MRLKRANENGELILEMCVLNKMVASNIFLKMREIHKKTWVLRMGGESMVSEPMDYIPISTPINIKVLDVNVLRAARDVQMDHHLVFGSVQTKHGRSFLGSRRNEHSSEVPEYEGKR